MIKDNNNPLVYSTEQGRINQQEVPEAQQSINADGIVKIQRQVQGRKGKPVTVITGLALTDSELLPLLSKLKKRCAAGGASKHGVVEIQGDKRELIKALLEADGWQVKII